MESPSGEAKLSKPVKLKLRTNSILHSTGSSMNPPLTFTTSPSVTTPSAATPTGSNRIILKRSQPPTPAEGVPILPAPPDTSSISAAVLPVTKTQAGRISKPTAKKRAKDDDSDNDTSAPPAKRPKVLLKVVKDQRLTRNPSIVVKHSHKAEVPTHNKGEGYDSEDDEKEVDPVIEEQFIFRMLPGEHCEYLHKMVEERKIGVSVKDGGADFGLRWLVDTEFRRALVTIKGTLYAGVLVDLPTITEGMKTWDRKNFMKSADICQMLLIFARVFSENEAKTVALPKMVAKDYRWPHGLTPPMHDVIHRRFRKRLSKKEIKDKEAELQRLLTEDRNAISTSWELVDDTRPQLNRDENVEEVEEEDADADGEVDDSGYFPLENGVETQPDIDDEALEAEFFQEDGEGDIPMDETPIGETPTTQLAATPATAMAGSPAGRSEVSVEDASDDDDDDDDLDEDAQAEADHVKAVRQDIKDLEKKLEDLVNQRGGTLNPLLRKRIDENIRRVKSELSLKKAAINETEE